MATKPGRRAVSDIESIDPSTAPPGSLAALILRPRLSRGADAADQGLKALTEADESARPEQPAHPPRLPRWDVSPYLPATDRHSTGDMTSPGLL